MHRSLVVLSVLVLLGVSMVAAQDSAGSEERVWVPIPATPGTNGGYTVRTPGEAPITVRSDWSGGYTIQQVGEVADFGQTDLGRGL